MSLGANVLLYSLVGKFIRCDSMLCVACSLRRTFIIHSNVVITSLLNDDFGFKSWTADFFIISFLTVSNPITELSLFNASARWTGVFFFDITSSSCETGMFIRSVPTVEGCVTSLTGIQASCLVSTSEESLIKRTRIAVKFVWMIIAVEVSIASLFFGNAKTVSTLPFFCFQTGFLYDVLQHGIRWIGSRRRR